MLNNGSAQVSWFYAGTTYHIKVYCNTNSVLLQRPHFGALAFTLNIFRACLVGPLTLLFWLLLTTEDCNALTQRKGWAGQVSVTWSAAITLPKVNRIKQVTRSTVNCVLLSALAGAIRRLLQGCGVKQPPDLKVTALMYCKTNHEFHSKSLTANEVLAIPRALMWSKFI